MHKDKHYRKFRHFYPNRDPSSIQKDILPFDTCSVFPFRREYWCQARSKWVERLDEHDLSGLCRPDPFGINQYHLGFSLNKKKRWMIEEEIGERIEEVQDPRSSLRVSAFVRDIDRSQLGMRWTRTVDAMEHLGCVEYHSVSRDSEVTHGHSNKRKTRVRSFTHPNPQPSRKVKGQPRRPHYREDRDSEGFDLPFDEERKCQLLHIAYTITLYSDRASLHNKASLRSPFGFRLKLSKKYRNIVDVEDDREWDSDDVVEDNDDKEVSDRPRFPPVDLSSLIVDKAKGRRKNGKSLVSSHCEEEEDGFVVVEQS